MGALRGVRGYSGLYTMNSADVHPIVGETPVEGFFMANGCSGHGFKLAPALGKSVAEMVLGRPDPRLAQFSPARFAAGELLAAGYRDARILG